MENKSPRDLILKTLKEKSSMKQDVYANTLQAFLLFKKVSKETIAELSKSAREIDKRIVIEYKEKGEFEFELRVAGDLLIFSMHTNVFDYN